MLVYICMVQNLCMVEIFNLILICMAVLCLPLTAVPPPDCLIALAEVVPQQNKNGLCECAKILVMKCLSVLACWCMGEICGWVVMGWICTAPSHGIQHFQPLC